MTCQQAQAVLLNTLSKTITKAHNMDPILLHGFSKEKTGHVLISFTVKLDAILQHDDEDKSVKYNMIK